MRTSPIRAAAVLVLGALLTTLAAGCGTGGTAAPAATATAPLTVDAPVATRPPTPATGSSAAAASSWTMPNLVGRNLQDAQDAIQALTSYGIAITRSHDATGAGRHQILDRDWKVCAQNVAAGTRITSDTLIDFAAAKLAEKC